MKSVANDLKRTAVFSGLAFENPAVGKVQTENFSLRAIRYGIELNDGYLSACCDLEPVTNATKRALTTVKTSDAADRLTLRHAVRLDYSAMQTIRPAPLEAQ